VYNLIATLLRVYAYNLVYLPKQIDIMKHIGELLESAIIDLDVNHRPHWLNADAIRKEKACLIEDIFRVMKCSIPMNSIYADLISDDAVNSFDALYDMSIAELELLLARLSAELKMYMRSEQQRSMQVKFIQQYGRACRNKFRDFGDDILPFNDGSFEIE